MNYYVPEIPSYPTCSRNGLLSAFNGSKNTKFLQNHYNSELQKSTKYVNSEYSLNYKVAKSGLNIANTQNDGVDRFEVDDFHISNIGGNITATVYSLVPEWMNSNYGKIQSKSSEYHHYPIGSFNKCSASTDENQYYYSINENFHEYLDSIGSGPANCTRINTCVNNGNNINSNNGNNNNGNIGNGGNKRPRHFFCFSCNQFKPRSTKARFKVCKHVSCYHCLRKALHVEYWAAKNDIWDKCRAECPFCHISLDWTKMKPYIVLSLEAKQFPLMSLCDAEERQGEAFQVIQSFFPKGVPSHIIYGNKIDFSVKPKVTQILFGHYIELLDNKDSYDQFFQSDKENCLSLGSSHEFPRLEKPNFTDSKQKDQLNSFKMNNNNSTQSQYNNSSSSCSSSVSNITSKFDAYSQAYTDSNYYSYATSYKSASTSFTRASTATNTSTTATINTTTTCINISTCISSNLESEQANTEYQVETEAEEGKKDERNNDQDFVWARTYEIYPDIFVSWRRSILYPPL